MDILDIKPYPTGIRISKNHTLKDFVYDERAVHNTFYMQFVYQPTIVDNIRFLCETLIDPLESKMGTVFDIISGYRCKGLDMLVSTESSQLHLHGLAVDIEYFPGFWDLVDHVFHLPFHEMFLYDTHIHMSVKEQFNEGRFIDYSTYKLKPILPDGL